MAQGTPRQAMGQFPATKPDRPGNSFQPQNQKEGVQTTEFYS